MHNYVWRKIWFWKWLLPRLCIYTFCSRNDFPMSLKIHSVSDIHFFVSCRWVWDDIILSANSKSLDKVVASLTNVQIQVDNWCKINCISVNLYKSKVLFITLLDQIFTITIWLLILEHLLNFTACKWTISNRVDVLYSFKKRKSLISPAHELNYICH